MFIQLVGRTLHSDNGGILSSDNCGTGRLSYVSSSKLKKLIKPVLIEFVGHILHSNNGGNLRSDNGGTGCLCKITSSKLKKHIEPEFI